MKALLYNRILVVLGFVGLFIAGVLSLAKAMNVSVPCGPSGGCDAVTNHPTGTWFGVPVAYLGLGAYVVLTLLALLRQHQGLRQAQRLATLGFIVSAVGALLSIGLQFVSYFGIGQLCYWCLASAVVMVLTVLLHSLLLSEIGDLPEGDNPRGAGTDPLLAMGLGAMLVVALGVQAMNLRRGELAGGFRVDAERLQRVSLVPDNPKDFGSRKAPVTIVEFADLQCGACMVNSPRAKELVRQNEGKLRLVYRHLPLDRHAYAGLAAAMSEYAFEKGKFWDFALGVMETKKEAQSPDELFAIAQGKGLDVADLQRRLQNEEDPIYKRLTEDKNAANALGVETTPTFLLVLPNKPVQAYSLRGLEQALASPEVQQIMNGA